LKFESLLAEIRNCTICASSLSDGVRPVLQAHPQARVLIAGQAPGRSVHNSGIPFDDASGERLRDWMGITREAFYDSKKVAILPMSFCFPGSGKSGDLAPRKECASAWRAEILKYLSQLEITLVIGRYAQMYHMDSGASSVTDVVKNWRRDWPKMVPLPHPSPRNNRWLRRNPWFEDELIPRLRVKISTVLS
jgi:uracil-DNA glycosylase